jgi:hypothetical protein
MTVSRRLLLAGPAGAALALTATGSATRLAASPGPDPLAPWQAAPAAAHPDPRVRAVAWGVLAPNAHNRQPWIVELVDETEALVHCDLDRRLEDTDPFDRQITIGFGCFLELMRMAAASERRSLTITPFPDGESGTRLDHRPVAHLAFGAPGTAAPDPLFDHALDRRTNKLPYDTTRPVASSALAALGRAAHRPDRVGTTAAADRVATLRRLTTKAYAVEIGHPRTLWESLRLMRLGRDEVAANPDGIALWGPEIEPLIARGQISRRALGEIGGPSHRVLLERLSRETMTAMAHLWIATPDNRRATQVAVGADWLRINLAATALGVGLQPHSQALQEYPEMGEVQARVRAALGMPDGYTLQMLGRLGYGPPAPRTPRWAAGTRIRMTG